MIIFIYGEDTYRSHKFLKDQIEEFRKKRDPSGFNIVFVDGKNETFEKIFQEATSSPFLAERKMVIIKNILSSKNEKVMTEVIEAIKKKKFPEINVIVFFQEEEINKNKQTSEFFELLKNEKFVYNFDFLSESELRLWIKKEINNYGGKINSLALERLVEIGKNDLWFLSNLIDQLLAYKNQEEISSEDIDLFVEEKIDNNIFLFTEAVVFGDKNKALALLAEQRKAGNDDSYLLAMILRQFRILTQAKDVLKRYPYLAPDKIAEKIGQKPFVIKKIWKLLQKEENWFRQAYDLMLDMDLKIKNGIANQEILLDLLIKKF